MKQIPLSKPSVGVSEIIAAGKVLSSGWLIQGPMVEKFEKDFAKYIGVDYTVACNSCTSALELALKVFKIGVGDEVIVTPYSFIASANCILNSGAKPVFIDIKKNTYNMDVSKIEKKITKKTKAIIVVHQFGLMCDMDKIMEIAKKHNLKVIEDAACAHGAEYKGKKAGSIGDVGCFSFHPRKLITTGEGGMITTNNKELFLLFQALRNHGMDVGQSPWERHKLNKISMPSFNHIGHNFRMTDFQAAIGIQQLKKIKKFLDKRRKLAFRYNERLDKTKFEMPVEPKDMVHTYQSYIILLKEELDLDKLIETAKEKGIIIQKYMSIPQQPVYTKNYGKESLSVCKYVVEHGLALPIYYSLSYKEQEKVIKHLNSI